VLWLDMGTPGRLQLYVLLAHADRAIVRRLDAASDASAVQNLALLVREELAGSHVFATPALQQRDRSASPSPAVLESSPSPAALESPSEPLASQLPASPLLGVPMTVSIFGAGRAGLSRGSGSPPSWGGGVAMVACVSWPYTITAGVSGWLTPSYTVHGVGLRVLGLAPTVEWGWQVSALPLALEARVGVGAEYWQVSSRAPDGTHQTYGLWTAVVTAGPQVAWLVADPWRLTMGARAVVRSRAYDVSAEPSPSLLQRQAWVDAVVTVGVEHPW
jgi:hypothetical protein